MRRRAFGIRHDRAISTPSGNTETAPDWAIQPIFQCDGAGDDTNMTPLHGQNFALPLLLPIAQRPAPARKRQQHHRLAPFRRRELSGEPAGRLVSGG